MKPLSKTKFAAIDSAAVHALGVVRPNQLPSVVGFSHHTARRTADFPAPVQLSKRSIGWRVSDLTAWLDARPVGYMTVAAASPNLSRIRDQAA
jgi:predicted DNA-binding transcriptional regulator AlpA